MNNYILLPQNISDIHTWGKLYGSALPIALAEYCQNIRGIKLLITPNNLVANQLFDELRFFIQDHEQEILIFPDWETLPYDQFSPHQDIISSRLKALSRLKQTTNAIVITAVNTIMHRLCPPEFITKYGLSLSVGDLFDSENFRSQLQEAGYNCVNQVLEHGEFAIRGSIVDLFPMGSQKPFRIELFDDEIESLRIFDQETQRTIKKIETIDILPAHEFPIDEDGKTKFRNNFRDKFTINPNKCPIYESISNGRVANGVEYYLPLFFESTATVFDYLPNNATIAFIESIPERAESFWQEANTRYEQHNADNTRPILEPSNCFLSPIELLTAAKKFNQLRFMHKNVDKNGAILNSNIDKPPVYYINRHSDEPLKELCGYLTNSRKRNLLVVESTGRREVLIDLLKKSQITAKNQDSWQSFLTDKSSNINIIIAPLNFGAELKDANISIIVETQIFGEHQTPQYRKRQKTVDPDLIIRNLAELQVGAPVVHLDFGVGRYEGLEYITNQNITNEFLLLSYANDDKIYVPITSLHLISRYTGADPDHAPLHRLGSKQWLKEKKKAAEKIHDTAIQLLEIYAKREAKPGYVYNHDKSEYQQFASLFPFEETEDQKHAISQIINDMVSPRPMDRLICGDVGFGKTEVAMRATFIATQNNKQVCILAPTTLLAGQHFENFCDRFADFPINIELLSRFRSAKETEKAIKGLEEGNVDIIIGTHKILQRDVKFKNLGLLIIDEEHRFGVKQKEHIKSLRTDVDILSMTATPIPRTLNMAMAGIRDISLIATPPARRLAVKTFWQEREDSQIREAIMREILRGGQVFFLHNKVQTIEAAAKDLEALVPEAKICIAHGQMVERELERIMSDFYHNRFNVLLCTTIIENGIDIPTANTIIIDRADTFGLSQLHQLRGRVGRSHHQAYAYLLSPNEKLLNKDAIKRLQAIVSLDTLGAGFTLATHDLEIRGTGELLGEEQSGHIHAIGFNLYMEMLERAVDDLKLGKIPELEGPIHQGPEINLNLSAIIPEDYIGDIHTRLIIYKRISNAKDKEQLRSLQIELIDRFGLLLPQVKLLFASTELKIAAVALGINRIQASKHAGKISFSENPNINTKIFIKLIQTEPKQYQMAGPTGLEFNLVSETDEIFISKLYSLLEKLRPSED